MDDAARTLQIAAFIRFAFLFFQGVVLVKAGVPLAVVGQIEMIFFVINFFLYFWQNGTTTAMLSWASASDRELKSASIFRGMHVYAFLAVVLILALAQFPFGTRFDFLKQGAFALPILAYVFFSIPSGAMTYAYLLRNRNRAILWYTGITQGLQAVVVCGMIIAGYALDEMLYVLAGFAFLRWLYVLIAGKWFGKKVLTTRETRWAFVAFTFPLVIHAFNGGVMDYVDGWIVSFYYGEDIFALYRYGARELPLNAMMISGVLSGLIYSFRTVDKVDAAALKAETLRLMRWLIPVSALLVLLSPMLYTFVYDTEFVTSARIFNIYALTLISRLVLNQVYCYVNQHNWVLTWSTAIEVVLNIVLSILFIRWIGLPGIPLATVLAYVLQKIFLIRYVRVRFGARLQDYLPVPQSIWYFSVLIGSVVIAELIYF